MAAVEVPEELRCVITHELLQDAVVDPDGNTYSKAAIEEWLAVNGTSPVTRKPLSVSDLVPNRVVRDLVERFVEVNGAVSQSVGTATATPTTDQPQTLELHTTRSGNKLLCSVVPPSSTSRLPMHTVAVIDTSGSMNSSASAINEAGKHESHGLTQLDLVKHSIRTVIECLGGTDRLSLVAYSSTATIVFENVVMTAEEKKKAKSKLDALNASGQTNLWDGLFKGMEIVRKHKGRHVCNENIMLFTDGLPNVIPPRGHVPMLKRYIDEHGLVASINTFGFGYSLDSQLLHELAVEGMGAYGFIPDSMLVGTVFVNAISNQMAKCYRNVVLNIEETESCKLEEKVPVQGGYEYTKTTWGVQIRLGDIAYGQPKDVVLSFETCLDSFEQPSKDCLSGVDLTSGKQQVSVVSKEVNDLLRLEVHNLRTLFVDTVRHAIKLGLGRFLEKAKQGIDKLQKIIAESGVETDQVKDLLCDLTGQVREALEEKYFDRWGKHYLPSLMTAHLHQQCNNFKDPGVQHYGGALFTSLRNKADDIFVQLPPPTPSPGAKRGGYGSAPAKPVKMKIYHNKSGGCIAGDGLVETPEGHKRADTVRRGDVVCTADGDAEVLCVVRMVPKGGKLDMVAFAEGLKITPYHPILHKGQWVFPCDVKEEVPCCAELVYDFVLSHGHTVTVNGITCVTLGHSFTAPVVAHEYFGSPRVTKDLQAHPSYHTGEVTLTPDCFVRGPDGRVVGLVW